jgi:hypothetical protein
MGLEPMVRLTFHRIMLLNAHAFDQDHRVPVRNRLFVDIGEVYLMLLQAEWDHDLRRSAWKRDIDRWQHPELPGSQGICVT